ncbi:unnamed protein product, partial [Didymodactylos carnosus]
TNLPNKNIHKVHESDILTRTESDDSIRHQNYVPEFLNRINRVNLQRLPYSYSTGCIGRAQRNSLLTHSKRISDAPFLMPNLQWQQESTTRNNFTNILEPKYFIAEEENEAILAKELQEAKIQSSNNSCSSIHSSHPKMLHFDPHAHLPNVDSKLSAIDGLVLHSKSLSSLSSLLSFPSTKQLQKCLSQTISLRYTTGIVYDDDSLDHECYCKRTDIHLENPRRLLVIHEQLRNSNLLEDCEIIHGRFATIDMLTDGYDQIPAQQLAVITEERRKNIIQLPCGGFGIKDDTDTVWNDEYTIRACLLAVGNTIELAKLVWDGKLKNGFSLVRPPGHHATDKPLGFCYFNNVAITAKWLKKHRNLQRIAIVDWDIHHGNGTQNLTYEDPNILYISLHRFDNGTFFPGGGNVDECGFNDGVGKNVNIPWNGELEPPMSDVEYLAAFRSVIMPILEDFRPQIILVSCGFDGAVGHPHPLGGYELTPMCFAYMTKKLMSLADGKVILVLEGGYELSSLAECGKLCVEALLSKDLPTFDIETLRAKPNSNAIKTLKEVIHVQKKYWPTLKLLEPLISLSHDEAISIKISSYYSNNSN